MKLRTIALLTFVIAVVLPASALAELRHVEIKTLGMD
jgi:hypothetical protein